MADRSGTTTSVIEAAIAEATGGGDGGDEGVDLGGGEGGDEGGESGAGGGEGEGGGGEAGRGDQAAEGEAEKGAGGAAGAKAPTEGEKAEQAKLAKELEELGLKATAPGQRENRIPYSRVVKIIENAKKKVQAQLEAAHTTKIGEFTGKLTAAEERLKAMDNIDRALTTEAGIHQYFTKLAENSPTVKSYLDKIRAASGGNGDGKVPESAQDPMPQPDGKYADGTPGYTAKGFEALQAWNLREATRVALKQVETRYAEKFGPIESDWKKQKDQLATESIMRENLTKVRADIAQSKKVWGKLFDENEAAIAQALKDNPTWSIDHAATNVLYPKVMLSQNQMREQILKEQDDRAKAAERSPGLASGGKGTDKGPKTVEDIIRGEIAKIR